MKTSLRATLNLLCALAIVGAAAPPVAASASARVASPMLAVGGYARIAGTWTAILRATPTTTAAMLRGIPRGQVVRVVSGPRTGVAAGHPETWYGATYRGSVGYLRARFLAATPLSGAAIARGYAKIVVVSLATQQAEFYQGGVLKWVFATSSGQPLMKTPVAMWHVVRKFRPYTMRAPFPTTSVFWYATYQAHYAIRFDPFGDYLHDIPGRLASDYGYGTDVPHTDQAGHPSIGSLGCLYFPVWALDLIYPWIEVGTPVDVIAS